MRRWQAYLASIDSPPVAVDDDLQRRSALSVAALAAHHDLNVMAGSPSHSLGRAAVNAEPLLSRTETRALRSLRRKANIARHTWPSVATTTAEPCWSNDDVCIVAASSLSQASPSVDIGPSSREVACHVDLPTHTRGLDVPSQTSLNWVDEKEIVHAGTQVQTHIAEEFFNQDENEDDDSVADKAEQFDIASNDDLYVPEYVPEIVVAPIPAQSSQPSCGACLVLLVAGRPVGCCPLCGGRRAPSAAWRFNDG